MMKFPVVTTAKVAALGCVGSVFMHLPVSAQNMEKAMTTTAEKLHVPAIACFNSENPDNILGGIKADSSQEFFDYSNGILRLPAAKPPEGGVDAFHLPNGLTETVQEKIGLFCQLIAPSSDQYNVFSLDTQNMPLKIRNAYQQAKDSEGMFAKILQSIGSIIDLFNPPKLKTPQPSDPTLFST